MRLRVEVGVAVTPSTEYADADLEHYSVAGLSVGVHHGQPELTLVVAGSTSTSPSPDLTRPDQTVDQSPNALDLVSESPGLTTFNVSCTKAPAFHEPALTRLPAINPLHCPVCKSLRSNGVP